MTDRVVFVLASAIWVANSTGEKCVRRCMSYDRGWERITRAQRCAGRRHSRSGTVDRMSNQRKIVPEAPRFLHHFYFLCVYLNADK